MRVHPVASTTLSVQVAGIPIRPFASSVDRSLAPTMNEEPSKTLVPLPKSRSATFPRRVGDQMALCDSPKPFLAQPSQYKRLVER